MISNPEKAIKKYLKSKDENSIEAKWEKMKSYIDFASKEEFELGFVILNLINSSLKNTIE